MQEYELVIETTPGITEAVIVPEGTTIKQLADEYQENYKETIILASVDGKLRELSKPVKKSGSLTFLTMTDRDGKRTYRRSVTLLMQKAVENLWGDQVTVYVYYSLGEGYYCELEGQRMDQETIDAIKDEMRRLAEAEDRKSVV